MIRVTVLNGKSRYVNAEMIECVESNPDTQIMMSNGKRVFVRESPEQVVDLVINYRQRCNQALDFAAEAAGRNV